MIRGGNAKSAQERVSEREEMEGADPHCSPHPLLSVQIEKVINMHEFGFDSEGL